MDELNFKSQCKSVLYRICELVSSTNKKSVLIVLQHTKKEDLEPYIPAIRESVSNVICFLAVGDTRYIKEMIDQSKECIDKIIVDVDPKRDNSDMIISEVEKAAARNDIPVSFYSDYSSWVNSSVNFIQSVERNRLVNTKVLLIGRNALATRMIETLLQQRIHVYVSANEYETNCLPLFADESIVINSECFHIVDLTEISDESYFDVLLGMSLMENNNQLFLIDRFRFRTAYDVGIKNFTTDFIKRHRKKGTAFYRSDDRAGIASAVVSIMETDYLIGNNLGKVEIGDISVVSGGLIGDEGDLVVDNAYNPSLVLGVALGDGTFKTYLSEKDIQNKKKIESLL